MKSPDKKTFFANEKNEAWDRFERAVDIALHTRPIHKESPKKATAKPKASRTS